MKKYLLKSLCLGLCLIFLAVPLSQCSTSAGGETPSAEIPAPVSHLSISSPDSDGLARVTADAGFADGSSEVTITNTTSTSSHFLMDFILRQAWAQATQTVTANADGSFQESIEASAGDEISISYIKDSVQTDVTDSVPENKPPLPQESGFSYQDVTYNPSTNEALVLANDGTDGFLVFFNLDTQAVSTVTLDELAGANRLDLDVTNQIVVIADETNPNGIFHYHIPTGNILENSTSGNQVVDVALSPSGNYAVIAFEAATPAFAYYDIVNDIVAVDGTATDGNGGNQSLASSVAVASNGTSDVAALVSEATDGSFFLSTHAVDTATPAFTQQTTLALSGLSSPGGLVFFNQATEALVADRGNDLVLSVVTATGILTSIDVEDEPNGIAVNSLGTEAYVVNGGERTLSVIDLSDLSVSRGAALGLTPTMIAVDPSGTIDTVIILNTGDNTLTLFDP